MAENPRRKIGEITFEIMQGRPLVPANVVDRQDRLGRDYGTYRQIGARSRQRQIRTITLAATADAAATAVEAQMAMQATTVTIYDADGIAHLNCKILEVRPVIGPAYSAGLAVKRVLTEWTIEQLDPDG